MAIIVCFHEVKEKIGRKAEATDGFILKDFEVFIMREKIYMNNFQEKDHFMTKILGGKERIVKDYTPLGYTTIKDVSTSPNHKTISTRIFCVYKDENELLECAPPAAIKAWQEHKAVHGGGEF